MMMSTLSMSVPGMSPLPVHGPSSPHPHLGPNWGLTLLPAAHTAPTPTVHRRDARPKLHLKSQLPRLAVTLSDVTYRGEGADHIVLRLISSGQVLRLRKTTVGVTKSSRDSLVMRATRDEEFLQKVAVPLLGPLLTQESRLVLVELDVLATLRHTIEPWRQGHRQDKEINRHGVACVCSDAATVFNDRAEPVVPSSFTCCSRLPCAPPVLPPLTPGAAQEETSVTSSASVPRAISQDCSVARNLRESQVDCTSVSSSTSCVHAGQTADLCRKLTQEAKFGDKVSKPDFPREIRSVCIEIKPKQGFLDFSTPELPLCRYCVKQFLKRAEWEGQSRSSYCPLDLFSGNLERMRRAMDGMFESPQNNLKVFLDGEPVEDCQPFKYLRDVIIAALIFDFSSGKTEMGSSSEVLSDRSPLGRIMSFQMLDQLGVYSASRLYRALERKTGSRKIVDNLLLDLDRWTACSQPHISWAVPPAVPDCLGTITLHPACHRQALITNSYCHLSYTSVIKSMKEIAQKNDSSKICPAVNGNHEKRECDPHHSDSHSRSITSISNKMSSANGSLTDSHQETGSRSDRQEDNLDVTKMVLLLQNYLLSTTAKDLSLMILVRGPYTSCPGSGYSSNASPFIIEVRDGIWFTCQVTGVDLVSKPPSKILKHEKDYEYLKDILLDLRSRGEEPKCCRL